jgi:hypothetical protein
MIGTQEIGTVRGTPSRFGGDVFDSFYVMYVIAVHLVLINWFINVLISQLHVCQTLG